MPAVNVATTDTFEIQRLKINQIGDQIFNISQGGSDLATGNLKLGDGTRTAPSLAFTSDASLGIYKPEENTFGFVSSSKKVSDFSGSGIFFYKDFTIRQNVLVNSGIAILSNGQNYDTGSYSNVALVGGTGDGATAEITVVSFDGEITNSGSDYIEGFFTNIPLVGGTGTGATASFDVEGIQGYISNAGSGYNPGTYTAPLTGGSGTGATAEIFISGTIELNGSITNAGSGYTDGVYPGVQVYNVPTQTFVVTTTANPGTPPPNNVYVIDGNTQDSLTLTKGNTYRFDLSDASVLGHPLIFQTSSSGNLDSQYYSTFVSGVAGNAGSFVDFIIKPDAPTETIKYNCLIHDGMGANISIIDGSLGNYGTGAFAEVEVLSGEIDSFSFIANGSDYKQGDVITLSENNLGGSGSGFEYTLSAPTYTGEIASVTILENGQGYLNEDVLSANVSDLGGFGSGFSFVIDNDPEVVTNFTFSDRGSNYSTNDILELPKTLDNISTVLNGVVQNISTTLSDVSPVITVADTTGIVAGMNVSQDFQNDIGQLSLPVTVLSVDSSTQITLSSTPTTSGSATLSFQSVGNLNDIEVSSVEGIFIGSFVTQTSGNGIIPSGVTVDSIDNLNNIITLSENSLQAGSAILSFKPPFGDPVDNFTYEVQSLGAIESVSVLSGGNGYSSLDQLTVNSTDLTQPIIYSVTNKPLVEISFVSTLPDTTFSVGDVIKKKDGSLTSFNQINVPIVAQTTIENISTTLSDSSAVITVADTTGIVAGMLVTQSGASDTGLLGQNTRVLSVDSSTQITLTFTPSISGTATLVFTSDETGSYLGIPSTTSGNGIGATFDLERSVSGIITSISINQSGYFYEDGDTITILGSLVGGSSPTHDIELEVSTVQLSPDLNVYVVNSTGGNIDSILTDYDFSILSSGDFLLFSGTTTPEYEIDTASGIKYRFFIDSGSGEDLTPNLTLFSGNTYQFDLSDASNDGHLFSFSKYRDGIWSPSFIENISAVLVTTSSEITVEDSTGILSGMAVSVTSGTGTLTTETTVLEVNGNIITLSSAPTVSGAVTLSFRGVEYTDNVVRTSDNLTIRVTDDTPNLYYYCATSNADHADEGGEDNLESIITIDTNNPKVFGSGFLLSVAELSSSDVISGDVETGTLSSNNIESDIATFEDVTVNNSLSCSDIIGGSISLTSITGSGTLSLTSTNFQINANLNIGSNIQILSSSGNITTSGVLKTTNSLNVNDALTITNNNISSTTGNDILLTPVTGRVAKVNTNTALIIPSGTTSQRPTGGIVENGSIRFNTETGQYEGYNASTTSWSSLGGVRDLDGNTYIAAEASIGANDNTLYFYNDGNNSVSVTPNYLQFVDVKKIRSVNTTAPAYTDYTTNTQVTLGQYLKYQNNIYEVTVAGQTGTSGNEPTHTTGAVTNGTAELTWYTTAIAPLTFEEISEVRIDPLGFTDLVVNAELRFSTNVISTDLNDLIIQPNSGKKVTIDAETSLVIPVGDNNQRGVALQGSIRYNTDISQYEGYDGSNWTSLGGVKDVDGNTYIIPETAPGANENILYFYNDGVNTMRLSTNALDFTNIDTITSQNNNLDLEAQTVTFNSLAATIDTSGTSTFISTTKDNLDLGLAVGLNVDPLLRLDINGDIYLNKAFGTGSFDGIRLFSNDLSSLELSDLEIQSSDIALIKGGTNAGASVLYDPTRDSGVRVTASVVNQTTGDKEMIEYQVIDKGSDIYHTEIGNLKTGANQVTSVFDFDANNNVRVTFTLDDNLTVGDVVNITVVKNIFKN